jgi:hypothetical protein
MKKNKWRKQMKKRVNIEEHERGETDGFHAITNGRNERSLTTEELEIYRFMIGGIIGK